ncbi:MAG: hypothetical protein M1286_03620 [Candidatus Marsarchaeota archaeon]|nr:hypothetical protein [Candidatus Marsarchaeota archaeon]
MGTKTSMSEQQVPEVGLQILRPATGISGRHIAELRSEAMGYPERRASIIQTLEGYMAQCRGTRKAEAACNAVTSIMAVSMLEILQED